jgi:hypothetical protein
MGCRQLYDTIDGYEICKRSLDIVRKTNISNLFYFEAILKESQEDFRI